MRIPWKGTERHVRPVATRCSDSRVNRCCCCGVNWSPSPPEWANPPMRGPLKRMFAAHPLLITDRQSVQSQPKWWLFAPRSWVIFGRRFPLGTSLQAFFERSWKTVKPSKLLFCAHQKLGLSERVDVGTHPCCGFETHDCLIGDPPKEAILGPWFSFSDLSCLSTPSCETRWFRFQWFVYFVTLGKWNPIGPAHFAIEWQKKQIGVPSFIVQHEWHEAPDVSKTQEEFSFSRTTAG